MVLQTVSRELFSKHVSWFTSQDQSKTIDINKSPYQQRINEIDNEISEIKTKIAELEKNNAINTGVGSNSEYEIEPYKPLTEREKYIK